MKMKELLVQLWMQVCTKHYTLFFLLVSSFCVNLIIICNKLLVPLSKKEVKGQQFCFNLILRTLPLRQGVEALHIPFLSLE
jgi:hypothetical protein